MARVEELLKKMEMVEQQVEADDFEDDEEWDDDELCDENLFFVGEEVHFLSESIPSGLSEVKVVRDGKVVDVPADELRKQKIAREKSARGPKKKRGPLSAATKRKIALALKKAAKLRK